MTAAQIFALSLLAESPVVEVTVDEMPTEFVDDEDGWHAVIPTCTCCGEPCERHLEPSDGSVGYPGWDYTPGLALKRGNERGQVSCCDTCGPLVIAAIERVRSALEAA